MAIRCVAHPGVEALWVCPGCKLAQCENCARMIQIGVNRFPYCTRCNTKLAGALRGATAIDAPVDGAASGARPPRQSRLASLIVASLVIVPVALAIAAYKKVKTPTNILAEAERAGHVAHLRVGVLAMAFASNREWADRSYRGHKVQIEGIVANLRAADTSGTPMLVLQQGTMAEVNAALKPSTAGGGFGFASLIGSTVRLDCIIVGFVDGAPRLEGCTLVDDDAQAPPEE